MRPVPLALDPEARTWHLDAAAIERAAATGKPKVRLEGCEGRAASSACRMHAEHGKTEDNVGRSAGCIRYMWAL